MARDRSPEGLSAGVTGQDGSSTAFGYRTVDVDAKQDMVDDVFHAVAGRYDLMNDVMSGGLHRIWKDDFVSLLAPPKSQRRSFKVLDMAGGTGDIAFRIANRSGEQTQVTVGDINENMLAVGRDRAAKQGYGKRTRFVQANAEDLPFEDQNFDAYTIAFGIRNVPRIDQALQEAYRVLRYGGRFMCLEFSQVDVPILEAVYERYSFAAIPQFGKWITGDDEPYQYLVESIRTFPNPPRFEAMIEAAGFSRVTHRRLTGGIVAIHSGWKL